jgi:hexosaminidase
MDVYRSAPIGTLDWRIPCVEIEDIPRFGWRGAHLDVARHFMPKSFIKKFIDLLALHKLNTFHWHLTEDQGWRIEIKRYPRLTEVGAWRKETVVGHYRSVENPVYDGRPHGGFYTQEDISEIVAYAQERCINVIPEIEMPGHAQAAITAYPELGNTGRPAEVRTIWGISEEVFNVNETTIEFLQNVLTEVLELFPSEFIHIGGDECPKRQWRESPDAQARMRELGLADEEELQGYFIRRMDTFLTGRGRRLVGWDEILEGGLAPNATVMSWRGEDGGIAAAKAGHDVVMAPNIYTYLDYYQSEDWETEPLAIGGYVPLEKVYHYEPVPAALSAAEGRHVLGTQGQLWTEYMPDYRQVEYMAFPRLCALAEVAWTPPQHKDYGEFSSRLTAHLKRLDVLDVNYRGSSV